MIHTCTPITKPCKAARRGKPISGRSDPQENPSNFSTNPVCTETDQLHRVYITSDAFKSKMQPARHRMVYTLLKDELAAEGGIHALQLRTRTVEEEEKAKAKESA